MRIPGITFHQGRNDYSDADGMHYGIAIHNTSNTANDTSEASYADHRTDGTSSHFYCDADSVTQSLDTNDRAGHAGSKQGNDNAIAFELTGTNDKSRQWWLDNIAWPKLGYVIAYILQHDPDYKGFQVRRASVQEMRDNPKVKAFYSHNDMRLAWGGTDHDDPGPNFPWDRLFSAVNAALGGEDDDMANAAEINASRNGFAVAQMQEKYKVIAGDVDGGKEVEVGNPLAAALKQLQQDVAAVKAAAGTPAAVVLDAAAEERIAVRAAELVAQHLTALKFVPADGA